MASGVNINKRQNFISILSGTIVSIALTLVLILLFAVIIRFLNVPDKAIFPVNQVIKIVSLFVGISIVLKKTKSKGFFTGIIIGLCYFVISYLVFSILQGSFNFNLNNFYDLLLTALMGGIIGIILINFFKR